MAANHEAIRQNLLDSAIKTVAHYGLEGTTTKMIAGFANINEAYIYRYYLDRNDLLKKSFYLTDKNFYDALVKNCNDFMLVENELSFKEKMYKFFEAMSVFYNQDLMYSLFYARYYYSTFMDAEVFGEHVKLTITTDDIVFKAFPGLTRNVAHVIFHISLDYILRVAEGMAKDSPEYRKECFDFMWTIYSTYCIK